MIPGKIAKPYIISIHSLRVEGDKRGDVSQCSFGFISIHSLRVEGDSGNAKADYSHGISIHSLRVEGD